MMDEKRPSAADSSSTHPASFNDALHFYQAGHLKEAEKLFRQVLHDHPGHAASLRYLGVVAFHFGRNDEAVDYLRQAVAGQPDYVEAWNNLTVVLENQGKFAEAEASCRQALRHKPDDAFAHSNLGHILQRQGKLAEAEASCRAALRFKPDLAEAFGRLGTVLQCQGRLQEAEECCRRALALDPHRADAHNELGCSLLEQGKLAESQACFEQALRFRPDNAVFHYNLAHVLLMRGDYLRGWAEYEWRERRKKRPLVLPQPLWDGSALAGRRILLHWEQGLGDTLQFIRYAPLVKERGGIVIVVCPRPLVKLLSGCAGIDQVVAAGNPVPAFDTHAPLMSLPHIFKTTLATIPAQVPYLFADAERRRRWGNAIADSPLKVGIAWQGHPDHPGNSLRSVPLSAFASLAEVAGVRWISMQYGPGTEQLARTIDGFAVLDLGSQCADFEDAAAAIMNLDLMITVDSVMAHCAGALGVPTWVLLRSASCFRWLKDREDSPWYPSLRLFRQSRWGDWDGVFARVKQALHVVRRAEPRKGPGE